MGVERVVQPDGSQPVRLLYGVPHTTPLPRGVAGGVLACAHAVFRKQGGGPHTWGRPQPISVLANIRSEPGSTRCLMWGAARFDETAGCGKGHRNRRSEPWIRSAATSRGGAGMRQIADAGAPSGGAGPERRNSARRKLAAVTRLLRGEPLETLARELNVTVARLSQMARRALVGAEAAMKERERDSRTSSCSGPRPSSAR